MEEKATLDAVEFQMGVLCSSLGTWIDKYVKTTMSCSLQYTTHLSCIATAVEVTITLMTRYPARSSPQIPSARAKLSEV